MQPELVFVEHKLDSYIAVLAELLAKGVRRIIMRGQNEVLNELRVKAEQLEPRAQLFHNVDTDPHLPLDEDTVVFLLETSPGTLSSMLLDYADATAGVICAPVTEHHMSRRAALANGIPKAGTHLIFELLSAFGFQHPYSDDLPADEDKFEPGRYYNLQHMTREHLGRPVHEMGQFVGAFCRNPVLFIIRDPRDVAASLAHYLSVQTEYHVLQSYFASLSGKQRLLAVIRGDYPLPVYINRNMRFSGNIRDLYLAYADWIRYPFTNTVVIRFEDLIGPRGGGDYQRQLRCIWIAQLALHVPGNPAGFAEKVFSPSSITFRKGQIGSHKIEFDEEHWAAFDSLCPDFVQLFGYDQISISGHCSYPFWRGFRGEVRVDGGDVYPQLLKEDYRGFNLIAHDGKVWAAAISAGPVDLHDTDLRKQLVAEGSLLEAMTVDGALAAVDRFHHRQEMEAAVSGLNSRLDTVASDVRSSIDGRLSEVEQLVTQQKNTISKLEQSHQDVNTKLIQTEAIISQLSAQQMEIANRHDTVLLELKQSQNEMETRIHGVQAVIREYSSGFSARLKRWIRYLFGRSVTSARKATDK
jgi:hypothetical protein